MNTLFDEPRDEQTNKVSVGWLPRKSKWQKPYFYLISKNKTTSVAIDVPSQIYLITSFGPMFDK